MSEATAALALRLAGPLQSWGGRAALNRRETNAEPTKSGLLGLLAAASGLRRGEPITELLNLRFAVRTDQPGSLLRDYHTAADYRGNVLPSASLNAKGLQKPTSPTKPTYVTERFYLQDAVFVAIAVGPAPTIEALHAALHAPRFPLALGRRGCPPTGPLVLDRPTARDLEEALTQIPWQAAQHHKRRHRHQTIVRLAAVIEDPAGQDTAAHVPNSFSLRGRAFSTRQVRHTWITLPTGTTAQSPDDAALGGTSDALDTAGPAADHDPFDLLGA